MSVPAATNGFSCINLLRFLGVASATKNAVLSAWLGVESAKPANVVLPTSGDVDDGCSFLVAGGFATTDGTSITATHIDADGRPSRLRRKLTDQFSLELLPNGANPQSL